MTWSPLLSDHPRSRGVYSLAAGGGATAGGSSPLARGLHGEGVTVVGDGRIIPARAGFTDPGARRVVPTWDHPRSRGVYQAGRPRRRRRRGSSPLARGLRAGGGGRSGTRRIIPARAGFTGGCLQQPRPQADHPRSRGVYPPASSSQPASPGSSPLARGLLAVRVTDGAPFGIIPARAGFTLSSGSPLLPSRDHPRSRGVYTAHFLDGITAAGSSPLARGLRAGDVRCSLRLRIIPARAGFTRHVRPSRPHSQDHPRSRGVYARSSSVISCRIGSSPLARGLQASATQPGDRGRIIPARAGFTQSAVPSSPAMADHPRSRGVYPLPDWRHAHAHRIIPARAGFTCIGWYVGLKRADHPRSRGVYVFRSS